MPHRTFQRGVFSANHLSLPDTVRRGGDQHDRHWPAAPTNVVLMIVACKV